MDVLYFDPRLLDALDGAAGIWKDVKDQAPTTQQNLIPLSKLWSQKTEEEMEVYQRFVEDEVSKAVTMPLVSPGERLVLDSSTLARILLLYCLCPSIAKICRASLSASFLVLLSSTRGELYAGEDYTD